MAQDQRSVSDPVVDQGRVAWTSFPLADMRGYLPIHLHGNDRQTKSASPREQDDPLEDHVGIAAASSSAPRQAGAVERFGSPPWSMRSTARFSPRHSGRTATATAPTAAARFPGRAGGQRDARPAGPCLRQGRPAAQRRRTATRPQLVPRSMSRSWWRTIPIAAQQRKVQEQCLDKAQLSERLVSASMTTKPAMAATTEPPTHSS